MTSTLSPHIEMGATELFVKDLDLEISFYSQLVGLPVITRRVQGADLGFSGKVALRLTQRDLPSAPRLSAGLYHVAILFEKQATLSRALWRVLKDRPELFQGSADHLVSEAFYFSDPEGNGVELYVDRPSSSWVWQHGNVQMASEYIDVQAFIQEHIQKESVETAKVGHVHLKVGSIPVATQFYVGVLGFHVTAQMPTAVFLSDGKYHHHLGMNTWESHGATQRTPSLGLGQVEIQVAGHSDLTALQQRLNDVEVPFSIKDSAVEVIDPWGNVLVFQVSGSTV